VVEFRYAAEETPTLGRRPAKAHEKNSSPRHRAVAHYPLAIIGSVGWQYFVGYPRMLEHRQE
jgi:hypothetical protein